MTISQIGSELTDRPWDEGSYVRVGADRLEEAIGCLVNSGGVSDSGATRRFIQHARLHEVSLDHLWGRVDGLGVIRQSVLIVPSRGRTAMVFATRARRRSEIEMMGRLIEHAVSSIEPSIANLAQVLLEPSARMERRAYLSGGFQMLAMLSYLRRPVPRNRTVEEANLGDDCRIVPYDGSLESDLILILDDSYEQTMDCPALRGLRRTADILKGHESTGIFDPSLWSLLYVNDRPSGAVLLNPSTDGESIELVYLGLSLGARGRGLGTQLLRHGLNTVAGRGEPAIVLAVDERNAPALSVYRREGFRPSLRRVAMIKSLCANV